MPLRGVGSGGFSGVREGDACRGYLDIRRGYGPYNISVKLDRVHLGSERVQEVCSRYLKDGTVLCREGFL
jgi:hypothetical protein